MNYIVTEKQLRILTENINLLTEQNQSIVPQAAIDAVSKIEKNFSYMENGKIKGRNFKGDEVLETMSNYIKDTIGFDCWNNLSDKFKSQIYAFCFQADTSVPYKFKFIAGLANAIDSSVDRSKIVGKTIDDENVKNAISLIKNNCNRLNSLYDSYLKIVDQQYKSMDYNDNYKFIWKYRPTAIDRILSGEDISKVLTDWKESFNSVTADSKKTQTNSTNSLDDYTGVYFGKDTEGKENKTNLTIKDNQLFTEFEKSGTNIKVYLTQTTQKDVFDVQVKSFFAIKSSSGTAKFNRNGVGDVCSVFINATVELTKVASKVAQKDTETVNLVGQKEGVSCDEPKKEIKTSAQKPADTSAQKPAPPAAPPSVPAQKPAPPAAPPVQKAPNTPPSVPTQKPSTQTNKTGTSKKQIRDLDIISPEKYSVRVKENYNVISEQLRPPRIYDAILVGGRDDRKRLVKTKNGEKKVLIDKTLDQQLEIFKKGFGGGNVKAFRYTVPVETILAHLKSSPRIPIFLFSAGCNLADELMASDLVDKNKVYVIEPFNNDNQLNKSVSNAIANGLRSRNIFVKKGSSSRGYGFSGANDSGASSHWDALRTVPEKVKS